MEFPPLRHWFYDACGRAFASEGSRFLDREASELLSPCYRQREAGEVLPAPKAPRGGRCKQHCQVNTIGGGGHLHKSPNIGLPVTWYNSQRMTGSHCNNNLTASLEQLLQDLM